MLYQLMFLCWGGREEVMTACEKAGTSNFQNYIFFLNTRHRCEL